MTSNGASGAPEDRERETARLRARTRERLRATGAEPPRNPDVGHARASVAARAFAALAENVRDYAIFLMSPDGIITFWGEGARLIKWSTKDEAEGAHLRLLYPAGGSDDGTAEEHLVQAAERGEYSGEEQRIRGDGSTFWAGITLTALRDEHGDLLGFAKVTRDLTARRAADAMLEAAVASDHARRDAVAGEHGKEWIPGVDEPRDPHTRERGARLPGTTGGARGGGKPARGDLHAGPDAGSARGGGGPSAGALQ